MTVIKSYFCREMMVNFQFVPRLHLAKAVFQVSDGGDDGDHGVNDLFFI